MKYPDPDPYGRKDAARPASDLLPAGSVPRDEQPAAPYTPGPAPGGYVVVPDPDTSGDQPFHQWTVGRGGEPAAHVARMESTAGVTWFCTVHPGEPCDHVAAVRAVEQE